MTGVCASGARLACTSTSSRAASDSRTFASRLLDEVGCVITPGVGFGPSGEGFYRVALTIDAKRLAEAMERLKGLQL